MGYCSNVTIYIKQNKKISLKSIERGAKQFDELNGSFTYGKDSNKNNILLIEYPSIKWYEGYDIVGYWYHIFGQLDYEEYLYTRQGEAWNDIEDKGELGYAYIHTEFDYDIDFTEN